MLQSLYIENIAVIRRLNLEPCPGFTVITGETGAGKSVVLVRSKQAGDIGLFVSVVHSVIVKRLNSFANRFSCRL